MLFVPLIHIFMSPYFSSEDIKSLDKQLISDRVLLLNDAL